MWIDEEETSQAYLPVDVDRVDLRMHEALTVSVVMCTRNRPDTIARAIVSVMTQDYAPLDMIVVDQSHDDSTRQIVNELASRYSQLRYIHLDQPGLSRAYNIGIENAQGAIVAFTDDDCVARSDWLTTIVARFEHEPDTQLIYGQVLLPEEFRNRTDGVTPTLPIPVRQYLNRQNGFKIFGMGANFAMRRSTLKYINGFDEILGGGGPLKSSQDFDIAYRVYLSGGTILLEPDSVVEHYGFRSNNEWPATLTSYGIGDGGFYFKHVRAGDMRAAWLLIRVLAQSLARDFKWMLLRRPHAAQLMYVRGILTGIRMSLMYDVDRHRRMYVARSRG